MKVLIVHNAYQSHHVGGEDIVVKREIESLKTILGKNKIFEYIVSNDDIQPFKLAFSLWGSRHHFNQVKRLVQENQIDIVHIHNFFPLLTPTVFAAAKAGGAKVVHTLHNFRWWCLSGTLYRKEAGVCEKCVSKLFAWPAVIHRCYRSSILQSIAGGLAFAWYRFKKYQKYIDAYFVLSAFQQEKLKSLISSEKMFLKPNLVDIPKMQLNITEKKNYLFVGRLESAKGIELLLSTWRQLPERFHLDIIGTGNEMSYFQKTFTRPNIRFLGTLPQDEVFKHMARAKYLLQPSTAFETFGLTMIEAMSCGTPVIGLDRGTRPEFIESGKNGFLCQLTNLKETILASYDYPEYASLCYHALNGIKGYDSPVVIKKQVALYQKVLANE